MSLYTTLEATASRLLTRFGQAVTLKRTDPTTGAQTSRTAVGVIVDKVRYLLGDSGVDIGDDRLLLSAAATPVKGERIVLGASDLVLVQVEPIQPGGVVLAWWAWARRG